MNAKDLRGRLAALPDEARVVVDIDGTLVDCTATYERLEGEGHLVLRPDWSSPCSHPTKVRHGEQRPPAVGAGPSSGGGVPRAPTTSVTTSAPLTRRASAWCGSARGRR
jgi:hypothetical protein